MKKLLIAVVAVLVAEAGFVGARADMFTFQPAGSKDLGDLNHFYHYTWGLNWSAPLGQQITSAVLTIKNVDNWTQPDPGNHLYTHLLDTVAAPLSDPSATNWVRKGTDWAGGGDKFAGQGLLLGNYTDSSPGTATLVYEIPVSYLGWLNDGNFGFGIDPDCHYYNDGISLTIITGGAPGSAVVPVPAAVTLGVLGLAFVVGWTRWRGKTTT